MKSAINLFVALFAAWLLWSGLYKPLLIGLGLASCAVVVYVTRRMGTVDKESVPLHLGVGIVSYWFWLLGEIVKSNVAVLRVVLSPRMRISPRIVRIQALPRGDVYRAVLANSITLTPGTVTTDVDHHGVITVHALTEEIAGDLEGGEMNRRVAAMERGSQ